MTDTVNNAIPLVPEATTDPAAGLNISLNIIDALLQVAVLAIQDAPPGSPADGDRYIVGTGSGAWAGLDDKLVRYVDATTSWESYDARIALNLADGEIYRRDSNGWSSIPQLPEYTVATLPSAANYTRGMIYVSDETGGAIPAFSDGTNWRRVTDRTIVS